MAVKGSRRHGFAVVTAALLSLLAIGAVTYAGTILSPENPETAVRPAAPPPVLMPPGESSFVKEDPVAAAARSGVPVAYLTSAPTGRSAVEVRILPRHAPRPDEVAFAIHSVTRYSGQDGAVELSVSSATPAVGAQPLILGDRTVRLADGSDAWTRAARGGRALAFVRGQFIITLVGDLADDELAKLATAVKVAQ